MASKINVDKIARGSGTPEFTIPTADGTAGQFLKTDGSGVLAFDTVTGTTINNNADNRIISGSATANTLEGETNLTYDGTSLGVKNAGTASDIKVYCENANSHYTSIKSAAHAAYTGGSWTMTLPGTDGTASQFLQTDGAGATTWATVSSADNTPAFQAYLSGSDQSIAHGVDTKVQCNSVDFDTASAYDNSTNYRFTVPAGEAGKYFCYSRSVLEAAAQTTLNQCYSRLYVNGANVFWCFASSRANPTEAMYFQNGGVIDLAVGDYLELYAYMTTTNSAAGSIKNYGKGNLFGAYKMIGI